MDDLGILKSLPPAQVLVAGPRVLLGLLTISPLRHLPGSPL